ncbi:MAG TPA: ATP-grasp domain-containing protein [Candidatus Babeliales bacterium]|nr:ATP-grasp domain-containing protein [Candidatus Babeliales bacterium]
MKRLIISLACITTLLTSLFLFKEILKNQSKKRILIVSPFSLDEYHGDNLSGSHNFQLVDHNFKPNKDLNYHIDECIKQVKENHAIGIYSSRDYLGNLVSCLVANKLGLPGPSPQAILTCHHKYYSRLAQQQYVPEACPPFQLIDPKNINREDIKLSFPLFVKPVKSYFSMYAQKVDSFKELQQLAPKLMPSNEFLEPINQALKQYSNYPLSANYLIAEELLSEKQVTIEGYIYKEQPYILGVTDSIMYPGTMSFERFQYPSSLPQAVQDRMADIAVRLMKGINFDNAFFNIEYFYNHKDNSIKIIEVNPRSVAQFADLYERVDGTNSYQLLINLAAGKEPQPTRGKGEFNYSASCALRVFEDQFITKTPTLIHRCHARAVFPDAHIRIFAKERQKLSESIQDGKSFMYAVINLGGDSSNDLKRRLHLCKQLLPFNPTLLTS